MAKHMLAGHATAWATESPRLLAWAREAGVMAVMRTGLGRCYAKQNAKDRGSKKCSHR
jgi:hypothetical protein